MELETSSTDVAGWQAPVGILQTPQSAAQVHSADNWAALVR